MIRKLIFAVAVIGFAIEGACTHLEGKLGGPCVGDAPACPAWASTQPAACSDGEWGCLIIDVVPNIEAGIDGDAGHDASPDAGTLADGPCPVAAPTIGQTCLTNDLACEYGTHSNPRCNVFMRCTQNQWALMSDGDMCPPTACPSTFDSAKGSSCSGHEGSTCEYEQGYCECVTSCGGPAILDAGAENPSWVCTAPATSECQTPRPHLGSSCSATGHSCSYEICCGGAEMTCSDAGIWTGTVLRGGCP